MTDREPGDSELLPLALQAAHAAGALMQQLRAEAITSHETKSSLTDYVTEADRAVERGIVDTILAARPQDSVLGEETTARTGSSGVRWVVDPIDGTTNYVYGIPAYAVSIAAEQDGQVVAGVVHDPVSGSTFAARRGGGATLDGVPIACSPRKELATALIGTGFGYQAGRRAHQARVLLHVLPRVRDIRRFGSAALDLCAVACGRLDAYYEEGLQPWDMAAGWLIATEAGARAGDLRGGEPSAQHAVVAPPALFDPLVQLLLNAGALGDA